MRVARSSGFSPRVLLVGTLALVFLSAPPVVRADTDTSCNPMKPDMQAGYRALEARQYADAEKAFTDSNGMYAACALFHTLNPNGSPAYVPQLSYWQAYALAGLAAAAFGEGKTADGLKWGKSAEDLFGNVINGQGWGEGASPALRRAASEGLAYVRALESAQKPILPKIWLDWKAAGHP